ncbi:MAG TPA: DUF4157 domain-containing protein [Longimicrobium sp.]|nr:DUF4157 domain-containing protein [Longimicrobium sp.]
MRAPVAVPAASPAAPVLRRACACGGSPGPTGECGQCRRKRLGLQRSASGAAPGFAPPAVHDVLASAGTPLDPSVRARMEPRFGHSFADVRVHTDARAADSARAVGAHAYAAGTHVVFGAGRYTPGSADGRRLIAHELAHVVQQRGASASIQPKLEIGAADDPLERDAEAAARAAMDGGRAAPALAGGARVSRAGEDAGAPGGTPGTGAPANPAPGGCAITVPSSGDEQLLAGVIFAEADAKRTANDEREGIGSCFTNAVKHTTDLCAGTLCSALTAAKRKAQCTVEKRDLGDTVLKAIKIGSLAHGSSRWNLVMNGNAMKTAADLCKLQAAEQAAVTAAITAAQAVAGGTVSTDFLRFNRAANQPPSTRMELSTAINGHTFYRFKPARVCG